MTDWGHEDLFNPPRLSAGYRLGKPTFAGTQGNGRDAPTADLSTIASGPRSRPEEAIPISRGQREVTPQSDAALRENSYYHHTVAVSLSDSRTL